MISELALLVHLKLIDEPNRAACTVLFKKNKDLIIKSPASLNRHYPSTGGYIEYLENVMNFATDLYNREHEKHRFPFTLSDVALVLFLHEIDKPFTVGYDSSFHEFSNEKQSFLAQITKAYKIALTEEHKNALRYIHGEDPYPENKKRVQNQLGAFCQVCVVWVSSVAR